MSWEKKLLVGLILVVGMFCFAPATQAVVTGSWDFVTIPGLPAGASLGNLWVSQQNEVYVWASTSSPRAILYHWNGTAWNQELNFPGYWAGVLFGTGPTDIFASIGQTVNNVNIGRMFHYDGTAWSEQALPPNSSIVDIAGEAGNVYATSSPCCYNYSLLCYDGTEWRLKATSIGAARLAYISHNEIYVIAAGGHYLWNGNTGQWYSTGFCFCDLYGDWGMRDSEGNLHLYVAGNKNFSDSVSVWKFTENPKGSMTGSWGSKYGTVFSDGSGYDIASAYGIWGSAPNDIYVVGRLGAWGAPANGRVYHFDGTTWQRITFSDDIGVAQGVYGTGSNNVWVSLTDGRLLHYGEMIISPPNTNPSANINAPNGGETWSGTQSILWTATDTEQTNLTADFYYGPSAQGSWTQIVSGRPCTSGTQASYSWNTVAMPNGAYYVRVVVSDGVGGSGEDVSNASFTINNVIADTTPPNNITNLQSSSHPNAIGQWNNPQSRDNTVDVSWTAAVDAGGSGMDGYSILWDTNSNTLPDTTKDIEETATSTTSAALADGTAHYFHIRSVDNAGNWATSAAHLGPFYIDTKHSNTPSLLSGMP